MKLINIITYNNNYGLSQDVELIVHNLQKIFKNNVKFNFTNFYEFRSMPADINIFLETPSKLLIPYAPINILIPNQEWFYKTWVEYLDNFDYILTKSSYAYDIFSNILRDRFNITSKKKIRKIGWKSKDMFEESIKKDYKKCFHLCGGSKYKNTQNLIDNWNENLPELTIVYNPKRVKLNIKNLSNITYITDTLSENDLKNLMNNIGIHICCSKTEGFGHYIQEAKSTKAIVITTNAPPMCEFVSIENGYLIDIQNTYSMDNTLGENYNISTNQLHEVIKKICITDTEILEKKGELSRKEFINNSIEFDKNFKNEMDTIFKNKKGFMDTLFFDKKVFNDNELPKISLITLTYNRRNFFKLALHNYKNTTYPKDKIEWIILDDGTDTVLDMLPVNESNINYKFIKKKLDIGEKRNYGVELATNEIIVFMDDDDYYPPDSLKNRIFYLLKSNKNCVVCSTIGCFDINKYVSIMNVPPHQLPFSKRVSEATLTFKKKFWNEQKFKNTSDGGEGYEFLEGRTNQCLEISWENIIVSLLHSKNTSTRVARSDKPNGCHFGFDDELFSFITELDKDGRSLQDIELINKEITKINEKKKKEIEENLKAKALKEKKEEEIKNKEKDEINKIVENELKETEKLKRNKNGDLIHNSI